MELFQALVETQHNSSVLRMDIPPDPHITEHRWWQFNCQSYTRPTNREALRCCLFIEHVAPELHYLASYLRYALSANCAVIVIVLSCYLTTVLGPLSTPPLALSTLYLLCLNGVVGCGDHPPQCV